MKVFVNFINLTIGTSINDVNNLIFNNKILLEFQNKINDYNNSFPLVTYEKSTIIDIAKDIEKVAKLFLEKLYLEKYYVHFDSYNCYKIENNKVYKIDSNFSYIDKNYLTKEFAKSFSEYKDMGIIREDQYNNLYEDFIVVNFCILEKGKPCIFVEPGELNKTNHSDCWKFIQKS